MSERNIQEIFDKEDIRQQIFNYSRSVDRIDEELGKAVFHPDATLDYGAHIFQGSAWEFIVWCLEAHRGCVSHSHQMGNISIWLDGSDTARSETYGDVTVRFSKDGVLVDNFNLVRYLDKWEKREGTWRIIERKCVHDLESTTPVANTSFPITGRRNKADASYFPDTGQT